MFENPVNLQFTFSGHYCINTLDKNIEWKTGIYSTFGRSNVMLQANFLRSFELLKHLVSVIGQFHAL